MRAQKKETVMFRKICQAVMESVEQRRMLSFSGSADAGVITLSGNNFNVSISSGVLTATSNVKADHNATFQACVPAGTLVNLYGVPDVFSKISISGTGDINLVAFGGNAGNKIVSSGVFTSQTIIGGDSADTLTGGSGNDAILGLAGNDTINGRGGADALYGGADSDTITGGSGPDTITGEAGDDVMYGNGGKDVFVHNYGDGNDYVVGGNGSDTWIFHNQNGVSDGNYSSAGDAIESVVTFDN